MCTENLSGIMANFEFRLQRVLEYREMQEGWAKDAFLEAQAARLQAEEVLKGIRERKNYLLETAPSDLDSRRALETVLMRLEDEDREQNIVLSVLGQEETNALAAWQNQKQELEKIVRMRSLEMEEWQFDENRREQNELDDWVAMRRTA